MLRQIWIVSALNFKSLTSRFWQSMVIVVGLAATLWSQPLARSRTHHQPR